MGELHETMLPGVGVRHEFTTASGDRLAILTHRTGRRELSAYSVDDPDSTTSVIHLSADDARTLAEALGASQVSAAVTAVQQQVDGLAIDWLRVVEGSDHAGRTIAEGQFRTLTGASVVAIVRGDTTIPAPSPDVALLPGDVVVAVGTAEGLVLLGRMLGS